MCVWGGGGGWGGEGKGVGGGGGHSVLQTHFLGYFFYNWITHISNIDFKTEN